MVRIEVRAWIIALVLALVAMLPACGSTPTPTLPTETPTSPPVEAAATETPLPTNVPATETPAATSAPELQAPTLTPTPTPTPTGGAMPATATEPPASACQGLGGQLEVQVLVGPADAVGLEPVAVGTVPFAVTSSEPPYVVQGGGPITYDATLTKEWGTYAVTMDMDTTVDGECSGEPGSERLDLVFEMTGDQLVVVDAQGFHQEYPWSGTNTRNLSFPLEEGANAQGEGWVIVLHLGSP